MKRCIYILLFVTIISACKKMEPSAGVADLNKEFIGAWNSKDSDKIKSLLADDVQFLQGDIHYRGKSEVGDKWVGATISTINNLKTNVVSSGSDEKTAYEAGTFAVDVLPTQDLPGGLGEGNFILLWKKDAEGKWKLSYAQLEDHPVIVR